ncbi:alpha-lytic protease prodomain-containing protein [Lentzea sp. NBRC 102530]|uniref:alpha-lytic protease prodomain-containing protein n=1 Tax=Lentzea sp. NBRC 102530 TaxID=3032201 RepID=UPI0024A263F3|nr:alpha-lytic protease prodomain-containing protein [Lentzea sp. NBRC 102530]GLY47750.1 serine protease [Lentzea sp. NBRC 102530]
MNRKLIAAATAAVTAAGLTIAVALTTSATAANSADPALLAAMARDLGISSDQARDRLAAEKVAGQTDATLKAQLGPAYAGSWLDGTGHTLTVAVTDPASANAVRSRGAVATTVKHSASALDSAKTKLDARATTVPDAVPGWYVDVRANKVVVLARSGGEQQARTWAAEAGLGGDVVTVEASTEDPKPLVDVIGGNAYGVPGGGRCSIGFAVEGGFVTAGHCGSTGGRTSNPGGTIQGSSFPGNDYAWVRVDAGNTPRALVNRYPGTVPVAGSQEAAVGSSVCRSGSTTGWRCGTIQQKNASVTYPEGTITGLTRTNACAEPGDSGGSWLTGDQAQGVTSGGSGNCQSGGTIYFQPVTEILQAYNLRLVTTAGPTTTTPPTSTTTTTPPGGGSWAPYTTYATGAQVTYDGATYRVIQPHTSVPGWEPPNTPALWQRL